MYVTLEKDLKTLCCTYIIPKQTSLEFKKKYKISKNRIYVKMKDIDGVPVHKVKISSLKEACTKLDKDKIVEYFSE